MRVVFYSVVDFRHDFVRLQYQALQHFVGGAELCVLNNAPPARADVAERISHLCSTLGVRCYSVENPAPDPSSIAHSHALSWGWRRVVMSDRPDVAVLLDFDLFPLARTSVEALLGDAHVAGCGQSRGLVSYFWPGLLAFDLRMLPNPEEIRLSHGVVDGEQVDTGGELHRYLRKYSPTVRHVSCTGQLRREGGLAVLPEGVRGAYEDQFNFEVFDLAWFHYGAGSNWNRMPQDLLDRKYALFMRLAEGCLRGEHCLG